MFDAGVETSGGPGIEAGGGASGAGANHGEQCDQLHRKLKRIVKERGLLDVQEAEALREAQKLAIWRRFGHSSLLQYLELEMGYSPRVAMERLRVANALPDLPKIAEAMVKGELPFSGARELTRVATPETEAVWLGAVADKNVREVEAAVSGHARGDLPTDAPDPKLQRTTMWLSVRPETQVMFREVRKRLEKERGERVDEDAVLEALCRAFLAPPEAANNAAQSESAQQSRASAAAPYRVAVTVCRDCKRGWQHGAGKVVEMSPAAIERAQCDAQEIGDVNSGVVERAKQTIPPAVRRAVLHRDQGRCRVPGCESGTNIDVHHIVFVSNGGTHDVANLVTLCEGHHLALHEGALAIDVVGGEIQFRRQGRNRFTRTTREIETRAALKARGFDRDAIRDIMIRTITHVGTTDLTAAQWLSIALRYAAEGRGSS